MADGRAFAVHNPPRRKALLDRPINVAPSAYSYPLLIKHLLHSSMMHAADQEIVYRDQNRFTYRTLRERIGRLASGLTKLGVRPGDTVGVMDWDTHRFLEAFFAVPMMGAVLQTVNVRLSHAQIVYTIEHRARRRCSSTMTSASSWPRSVPISRKSRPSC
jgi:acyl-CoA synthetase (AMP-forming)/AMP-acid ligase II